MSSSSVLNVRCAISTFKSNAAPLLNVLSDEARTTLLNKKILPLFEMPSVPQNVPLLYFLVKCYNREKEAFRIGKHYLKLTVNEVSMILGLPNSGRDFHFARLPQTNETHKNLIEEMHSLVEAEWSEGLEVRRINLLVKYLLVVFFFPLKTLRIPAALKKIQGLNDLEKYNWPKAIHGFLHSQVFALSTAYAIGEAGAKLGYLEGCTVVLVVWLYEHCNIQTVVDDLARPRIYRWSPNKSYSAYFCSSLPILLKSDDKVNSHFLNIREDEEILLAQVEDSDSDFEHPKKEGKRKPDRKMLRRLTKDLEKVKRREICVELQEESVKIRKSTYLDSELDDRFTKMESRLQSFIRDEIRNGIEAIKQFCNAAISRSRHDISPSSSPVPDTQLSPSKSKTEITYVDKTQTSDIKTENIIVSCEPDDEVKLSSLVKAVRNRHITKRKNSGAPNLNYPGKDFVSAKVNDAITFVLTHFPASADIIFRSGNIEITRRLVDDLLGTGWVEDTHLNVYSVVLSARKKKSSKKMKNFLYMCPDYANCKKAKFDSCTKAMVSHFSESSVRVSQFILMPCHFESHWALLVCDLRGCCWKYYDSLFTKRHFSGLKFLVDQLYEDIGTFMPVGYEQWPINEVDGLPLQQNGHDCGVYVMKFVEVILTGEIDAWDGWQDSMPKFRAEIAAEIFNTFSKFIKDNIRS